MQFSIFDYTFHFQTVPASARVAVFCGAKRILAYDIGTATWYDGAGQAAQADAGDAAVPAFLPRNLCGLGIAENDAAAAAQTLCRRTRDFAQARQSAFGARA